MSIRQFHSNKLPCALALQGTSERWAIALLILEYRMLSLLLLGKRHSSINYIGWISPKCSQLLRPDSNSSSRFEKGYEPDTKLRPVKLPFSVVWN